MHMDKLPPSINAHIFLFLSHSVSGAIRKRIVECQAVSIPIRSHTFYICFFLDMKIHVIIGVLDCMCDCLGVRVGVDDTYFRPRLWRLYESQFPGSFFVRRPCLSTGGK